jgi:5'-methylthioadenosine phosphorylase
MTRIGIIGGSGLDDPEILAGARDEVAETPWGPPSSPLRRGTIQGVECVLLARHGREHTIPPTFVNNRANLHALRAAGCSSVLATTAVGSLREEIGRGDLVLLDQFLDFTRLRPLSFHERFEPGKPAHTPMAEPFDAGLRARLIESARALGLRHHARGTVVTIEGPRFSTRAESTLFRAWGADVINMSTAPECALAAEAGLPYAAVAMATDYDSWKADEPPVTRDEITRIFAANVEAVVRLLVRTIASLRGASPPDPP